MRVTVDWTRLADDDPLWHCCGCLYAYIDCYSDRVLYLGKADFQSVYERTLGRHKREIFDFLDQEYGDTDPGVIQGNLILEEGRRFSSRLLTDVESLLIYRLQPPANIACTRSRIARPGMQIRCRGDWPDRRRNFHDR
jgi:hypothetical protein